MNKKIIGSLLVIFLALLGFIALRSLLFIEETSDTTPTISLKSSDFKDLPGWEKASNIQKSFEAFTKSCKAFLAASPEKDVGSDFISMTAADWQRVCKSAKNLENQPLKNIKFFFENEFTPYKFVKSETVEGNFTGYYIPVLNGSLVKTEKFNVPLYALPDDVIRVNLKSFDKTSSLLIDKKIIGREENKILVPYYTREEINAGAIDNKADIIAWLDSEASRQFLEIEGSGIVKLPDGQKITVSYDGENGHKYKSLQSILIDKGILTKNNASEDNVHKYFEEYPENITEFTNLNQSFVFFKIIDSNIIKGAQGVPLTNEITVAVDKKWIPYGTPLWFDTVLPSINPQYSQIWQKLMIAQDTGGAIRGPVRADIFYGTANNAEYKAKRTKTNGYYWLLLPKHIDIHNATNKSE